ARPLSHALATQPVEKCGLEKRQDARFGGGARWLVVAPRGQDDFGIVLQKPEPELHGQERAAEMSEQIGHGTTWVFRADDLEATYASLKEKGVSFISPPVKQPWSDQAIFEDPYGNRYALMGGRKEAEHL
ncbi:MAG: VOC family protein, partial [Candidatus Binatia bacterium]